MLKKGILLLAIVISAFWYFKENSEITDKIDLDPQSKNSKMVSNDHEALSLDEHAADELIQASEKKNLDDYIKPPEEIQSMN